MIIYLLRHGMTAGNCESRYIGTTDEPLRPEGIRLLKACAPFPAADRLYVSPMLRCRQTADILFPGQEQHIVPELRECDFGEFENKNYRELSGDPRYQAFIDSGGTLAFPGGESLAQFQERSVRAFGGMLRDAKEHQAETIGCVAHGGTVMSVLSALAVPKRAYYEYQVENGCGYALRWEEKQENMFDCEVDFPLSICYPIKTHGKLSDISPCSREEA